MGVVVKRKKNMFKKISNILSICSIILMLLGFFMFIIGTIYNLMRICVVDWLFLPIAGIVVIFISMIPLIASYIIKKNEN